MADGSPSDVNAAPDRSRAPDFSSGRYVRQEQFLPIGSDGQRRIESARVLVCGCGALGSVIANILARAGIGFLRVVDRDFLELNNLQRQVLYDEQDLEAELPKAVSAARRLRQINRLVEIDSVVVDVDHRNIEQLLRGIDIIADGTDNFETRFLINDAAVKLQLPWVYGGCIGAEGQSMTILPGETACFRCVMADAPPAGASPTCDSAGIVGPIVNLVGAWQAMEVLKLASGHREAVNRTLTIFDLWDSRVRQLQLDRLRAKSDCPTCAGHRFEWLSGERGSQSVVLCGRNSVQISSHNRAAPDLLLLAEKLRGIGKVTRNPYFVRVELDRYRLTVFADGRTIVQGTSDPGEARSLVARFIGN
jgi:adenylyltransferase/sulfurtransferase